MGHSSCPKCGAGIAGGSKKCGSCGAVSGVLCLLSCCLRVQEADAVGDVGVPPVRNYRGSYAERMEDWVRSERDYAVTILRLVMRDVWCGDLFVWVGLGASGV